MTTFEEFHAEVVAEAEAEGPEAAASCCWVMCSASRQPMRSEARR